MRSPDNAQVPGEGSSRSVGEGFDGVDPGEIEAYGSDFYDEYGDSYDDESSDDSFDDESDGSTTIDADDIPTDGEMTEEEAEDILEDALEEEYGSQADEMVEDLEEDTGMSAIEILEDITGLDLDGSEDDSSYASAESDFAVNPDGELDQDGVDAADEGMDFHLGH